MLSALLMLATTGERVAFSAAYVLVGIGILVEIARRLGMGFITARAELQEHAHGRHARG